MARIVRSQRADQGSIPCGTAKSCSHRLLARIVGFHPAEVGSIPTGSANLGDNEMLIVEIRAGEGGEDAKLLVKDQFSLYTKFAARRRL